MEHEIIMDLLPLYHDGVCSEKSRAAVEEHLQGCECCRKVLTEMDAPLPVEKQKDLREDAAAVKRVSAAWRRGRLKTAAIAVAVCALLAGLWTAATQLVVFPVDPERIEITELRQLADGRLLYHFYIDDDLGLRLTAFEYDEGGNMYLVPKRALIEGKRWAGNSPVNRDRLLDPAWVSEEIRYRGLAEEVTRIWYGRGEDAVLLWEKGMDLPAASPEDEAEIARYGADAWFI